MTLNVPSWLPFALGAVAIALYAFVLADASATPNSGQLIAPGQAMVAITIG